MAARSPRKAHLATAAGLACIAVRSATCFLGAGAGRPLLRTGSQKHVGPRGGEPGASPAAYGSAPRVGPSLANAALGAGAVAALLVGRSARQHGRAAARQHRRSVPAATTGCRATPAGGYCEATEKTVRRKTRTVMIGSVPVGSEHPIATQTMTTTLTHEVEATVAQIKKCADMGVDIVRVTVQGMREAKACEHIKKRLLEDGYKTPIVADIHFTPQVALACADFVDKVRVNPGNFVDGRKSFDTIDELTPADIKEAQDKIEETFAPLVLKLKEKNKALRIGVNHGSLAERILFQYGDSPEGMVASAIEFGDICRKYDYHNFVFSMKSSNPQVMVTAYRQLAREMYKRGWDYPLHLGVTEAGGGADGRIKSACGIGALLLDGIGDTIRVSLTEDPEFEAKPCKALRQVAEDAIGKGVAPFEETSGRRDGVFSRRKCEYPLDVPLNTDGSVLTRMTVEELSKYDTQGLCDRLGLRLRKDGDVQKDWKSIDVALIEGKLTEKAVQNLRLLLDTPVGVLCRPGDHVPDGATLLHEASAVAGPVSERLGGHAVIFTGEESVDEIETVCKNAKPRFVLLKPPTQDGVTFRGRRFFSRVSQAEHAKAVPAMLWFSYTAKPGQDEDDVVLRSSADFGSLFLDGMGEGILWEADNMAPGMLRESAFNLLQASRMRISKTEFISCPSCGRTLFNLQETTAKIQARTGHLPGVRIAVMGCIVNGPGEMADADFGYVGSGVGKVDLYVNYDCVKRAIPSEDAVDKLVELIKENGRWQEPGEQEDEELVVVPGPPKGTVPPPADGGAVLAGATIAARGRETLVERAAAPQEDVGGGGGEPPTDDGSLVGRQRLKGRIVRFKEDTGFVRCDGVAREIFFHMRGSPSLRHVGAGDPIIFDVGESPTKAGKDCAVNACVIKDELINLVGQRIRGWVKTVSGERNICFVTSHRFDGNLFAGGKINNLSGLEEDDAVEFEVFLGKKDGKDNFRALQVKGLGWKLAAPSPEQVMASVPGGAGAGTKPKPEDLVGKRCWGTVRSFGDEWGWVISDDFDGTLHLHKGSNPQVDTLEAGEEVVFTIARQGNGRIKAADARTLRSLEGQTCTGTVRYFKDLWGFVVSSALGNDIYVSLKANPQLAEPLTAGDEISFVPKRDGGGKRISATMVQVLGRANASKPSAKSGDVDRNASTGARSPPRRRHGTTQEEVQAEELQAVAAM